MNGNTLLIEHSWHVSQAKSRWRIIEQDNSFRHTHFKSVWHTVWHECLCLPSSVALTTGLPCCQNLQYWTLWAPWAHSLIFDSGPNPNPWWSKTFSLAISWILTPERLAILDGSVFEHCAVFFPPKTAAGSDVLILLLTSWMSRVWK